MYSTSSYPQRSIRIQKSGHGVEDGDASLTPHIHDSPDAVTTVHHLKSIINLSKLLAVCDELIHLQTPLEIIRDETGELGSSFYTTKSTPSPSASGHKLEGCDVVSQLRNFFGKMSKGKEKGNIRRVWISCPAAATPIMMLCPQPLWQASKAALITPTLPVQSKV